MGVTFSRQRRQLKPERTYGKRGLRGKHETMASFHCVGGPSSPTTQVGAKNGKPRIPLDPLTAELPTESVISEKKPSRAEESPTPSIAIRESTSGIYTFMLEPPPAVDYSRKPSLVRSSNLPSNRASSVSSATQDTQFSDDASSASTTTMDSPSLPPRPNSQLATFQLGLTNPTNFEQFDWQVRRGTKQRAANLHKRLISQSARLILFTDSHVFKAAHMTAREKDYATSAWNLISAGQGAIRCRHTPVELLEYFLHLVEAATLRRRTPCQIPIQIRVEYHHKTAIAHEKFHDLGEVGVAQSFTRISNKLDQGETFVAFLELVLEHYGPPQALDNIYKLIHAQAKFTGFRLVEIEEVANLLATLVRIFRTRNLGNSGTDPSAAINLFRLVVEMAERDMPELFHSVVTKLEGLEVPLCFGFFLHVREVLLDANEERYVLTTKELFGCLETHYATVHSTSHANSRDFMPFWSVVALLRTDCSSERPFLVSMHRCMDIVDKKQWKSAWCDFGREEEYDSQRLLIAERLRGHNKVTEALGQWV